MQQATTSHSFPRSVGGAFLAGALVLMLALGVLLLVSRAATQPASPPQASGAPAAVQPQSRVFTDEAAYVLVVDEYTSVALGEDYLPVAPPAPTRPATPPQSRFFRDELAGSALPEGMVWLSVSEQSGAETGLR